MWARNENEKYQRLMKKINYTALRKEGNVETNTGELALRNLDAMTIM